ncbi:globin [Christiangramia fulva]|uniref:Globin n=1 Tax=Christiangramia fulva TaxID=2126553 RepID=A0A2R3ZAG2_9FLAO|nr:group III truncated hemoglobin [Christiangramia fulva]AVR47152.1 globin [Christiangramia fulva]
MQKEIRNIEDIKLLVDTFYDKVRNDKLLSDIFNDVIKDRWPQHLEKMYAFWQTILLQEHTYNGSPFLPHAKLPVSRTHFHRWLELFFSTIDELFEGEKAEEAKWRASKMAEMFQLKIASYQNSTPLI